MNDFLTASLKRQLDQDRARSDHRPRLVARKIERMRASPFAFLRGSAPFFYELLREVPWLCGGPAGEGWLVGDLHAENFGAFRSNDDREGNEPAVVFDLSDFDEATSGPLWIDLLRLTTSVLLAARDKHGKRQDDTHLARYVIEQYAASLAAPPTVPSPPKIVRELVEKASDNTTERLLKRATEWSGEARKFKLDEEHRWKVSPDEHRQALAAFEAYARAMAGGDADKLRRFGVLDVAFRVAGTGSLGSRRYAVLTRGKDGPSDGWLFDMKEQGEPAASLLLGATQIPGAVRVETATRACLAHPPHKLGVTTMEGRSMLVRRLAPQEDKLAIAGIDNRDLAPLFAHFAQLTAEAHRRGASSPPAPWDRVARESLLERAVAAAGLHEAAHLAFVRLTEA